MPNLIMRAVPQEQTGAAGGINTIVRAVGGAVGVQICTTLIDQNLVHSAVPSMSGYTVSFWLMAAALIIATAVSLIIPTQRSLARRRSDHAAGRQRGSYARSRLALAVGGGPLSERRLGDLLDPTSESDRRSRRGAGS